MNYISLNVILSEVESLDTACIDQYIKSYARHSKLAFTKKIQFPANQAVQYGLNRD